MKTIAFTALALLTFSTNSFSDGLRIVSVNIASGCKGLDQNTRTVHSCGSSHDEIGSDQTVINIRRELWDIAKEAHLDKKIPTVFALQEVAVKTDTQEFDTVAYFTDRLQKSADAAGFLGHHWNNNYSAFPYDGGLYGIATISSQTISKRQTKELSVKSGTVGNSLYQLSKIEVLGERFWIINVHFSADAFRALLQLEETVEYAKTLDEEANIIIVGDYNIPKDGLHRTACPEGSENYKCQGAVGAYRRMDGFLKENGFTSTNPYSGPCWEANPIQCTFKASGQIYSHLDYAYIFRRNPDISTSVKLKRLERNINNENRILTDHYGLIVDLEW